MRHQVPHIKGKKKPTCACHNLDLCQLLLVSDLRGNSHHMPRPLMRNHTSSKLLARLIQTRMAGGKSTLPNPAGVDFSHHQLATNQVRPEENIGRGYQPVGKNVTKGKPDMHEAMWEYQSNRITPNQP
jgi:hypothetical protein